MDNKDSKAMKDAAERGKEALEVLTNATARSAGAATRRAADAFRRGDEAAVTAQAAVANAGDDAVERVTEQFRRIFGLSAEDGGMAAQQAQENLETIAECNRVLMDGMQAIWREWMGLARDTVHCNVDSMNSLMNCRSLPDLYAVQSELVKNEIALVLDRGARISTLSAELADDAMRRLGGTAAATKEARR